MEVLKILGYFGLKCNLFTKGRDRSSDSSVETFLFSSNVTNICFMKKNKGVNNRDTIQLLW